MRSYYHRIMCWLGLDRRDSSWPGCNLCYLQFALLLLWRENICLEQHDTILTGSELIIVRGWPLVNCKYFQHHCFWQTLPDENLIFQQDELWIWVISFMVKYYTGVNILGSDLVQLFDQIKILFWASNWIILKL